MGTELLRRAAENGHDLAAHVDAVVVRVAQFRRVYAKAGVDHLGAHGGVVTHTVAAHHEVVFPGQFGLAQVAVHGHAGTLDIEAALQQRHVLVPAVDTARFQAHRLELFRHVVGGLVVAGLAAHTALEFI